MENRNELDLGLMTTEDMKSVEKVFEEQNDTEMRSASAVEAGAGRRHTAPCTQKRAWAGPDAQMRPLFFNT